MAWPFLSFGTIALLERFDIDWPTDTVDLGAVSLACSIWKVPTIAASSSDCPESSAAAEDDSSEFAAFCWVTWPTCATALFNWSIPVTCSRAAAAISATMSLTLLDRGRDRGELLVRRAAR